MRVFENRVLRRTIGQNRDEVTGGWRKLHRRSFITYTFAKCRIIKSRRMRWAGHIAQMGRRGMHVRYWWESQKERDH
jgi:hypothetical protein